MEVGAKLIRDAGVHGGVLEAVEVAAGGGSGERADVAAGEIVEEARTKLFVAPRQRGVAGARNEAGNLVGAARGGAAKISVRADERVVGGGTEAFEQAGEKGELLLVVKFPAGDFGGAGIGGGEAGEAGVFAVVAVVVAGADGAGVGAGDDVVCDGLVEPAEGERADGFEVIFERGIPRGGGLRSRLGLLTVRVWLVSEIVSFGRALFSGGRPKLVDQLRRALSLEVRSWERCALGNDFV